MTISSGSMSVRGKSHEKTDKPCQDSSGNADYKTYSIAVVADGHGGEKYIRSDVGSAIAVDVAQSAVSAFLKDYNLFVKEFKQRPDEILSELENCILLNWRKSVEAFDEANPETDIESAMIDQMQKPPRTLYEKYGTTLVLGVMSKKLSFGIQLGDGDLVIVRSDLSVETPIPEDPECVLNVTASMCQNNAKDHMRHFYTFDPLYTIAASTDGFSTSFNSEESFKRNALALTSVLKSGTAWDSIKKSLEKRAASNREDDVSLAMAYQTDIDFDKILERYCKLSGREYTPTPIDSGHAYFLHPITKSNQKNCKKYKKH